MKVLTFGEIMLRLKAPGHERFFQSPSLEATFGGGEANVAVSLANYGMDAAFLTVLPKNDIAEACIRELRYFGVDTSRILRGEGRMGIYYLQGGANQLPSKVVYDRAYSAIALAKPGDIDWDKAFDGVDWFHITGITPAISETAMELSLESVAEAKKRGCNKIALGHHYDDAIGTVLMGLIYGGQVQAMLPRVKAKNYEGMELIRPLYFTREANVVEWAEHCGLTFLPCDCPAKKLENDTKRAEIKQLIASLAARNPQIEANIFNAVKNVDTGKLLGWRDENGRHSFLDRL